MSVLTLPPAPDRVRQEVVYPESDGEPVGETDFHIGAIFYLREALRYFLRDTPDAYVAANMLLYYEEGDPSAVKAPDVFVVKGIDPHDRRIYRLWVEGVVPCVVIEITSRKTWLEDMGTKRALYEALGIGEYFMFDPLEEYLNPRFQGFRLVGGRYEALQLRPDGALESEALGALLRPDGQRLRVVDPATGEVVPTMAEAMHMAQVEAEHAEAEAERADAALTLAHTEGERADAEAQRARAAEAEAERLRAELNRLRNQSGSA